MKRNDEIFCISEWIVKITIENFDSLLINISVIWNVVSYVSVWSASPTLVTQMTFKLEAFSLANTPGKCQDRYGVSLSRQNSIILFIELY